MLVTGHWILVPGFWIRVIVYWKGRAEDAKVSLLADGVWILDTGH